MSNYDSLNTSPDNIVRMKYLKINNKYKIKKIKKSHEVIETITQ